MNHYYYFIIGVIAVLVLIEIGTMITKRSKRKSVDAKYKSANISEWSYQRFARFFGEVKPYWIVLVGNPEPQADKAYPLPYIQ